MAHLLESLPMTSSGRPILGPASTWGEARRGLLHCATARAVAGALLRHQEACSDVWQDLWSQCCGDGCVPSRLVLLLQCCARLGASVCLRPALWVVSRARQ